ncbi:uncharacterized protein LOC123715694 [Pieris brassicae]|uniref:Uncharacterized protein n=1 Tax=Pieris brassicae TaxID=7116 RepID=A0A9P0TQX0_PIEBR|nr:uncharacterized protein LOC123715694 [Pieris brassicae]CAH4033261.1 unnamed protein product [Pieris brassicae]
MAFSIRNIISNISYFKKPGEHEDAHKKKRRNTYVLEKSSFELLDADSTSMQYTSLELPESVKKFTSKKISLSDTDILNLSDAPLRHRRRKCKKLKLDIKKASQSMNQLDFNVENTPKHVLLESLTSETFSERFKGFDFNKSFDINNISDIDSSIEEEELMSDHSNSTSKSPVRMCRKMCLELPSSDESRPIPSTSPESFADVEFDKNEEQRMELLLNYQMKLEKLDCFLKKMFNEFQFHIEVSKIFQSKSVVTALPGTDLSNIPKKVGDIMLNNLDLKNIDPSGSWNIIMEKEDHQAKTKVKKQLLSIKSSIDNFINSYLHNNRENKYMIKKREPPMRINPKKKQKYYDFPDLRDAMINLFSFEESLEGSFDDSKCLCKCHISQTDSGLTIKSPEHSTSISSSIGNFTLDTSKLTAYSESLDQVFSYNSFQDSLHSMFLQKATIERITFYIQVHSIQLHCESNFETKNMVLFYCPSCKTNNADENDLLKHILSQSHCEKIHFLYKTAYIKKCVSAGKEIQPSTVLNPMKMYRDDNKIVCFGDALYACSLCFENLIMGESVLMAHCSDPEHVERKDKLHEIIN